MEILGGRTDDPRRLVNLTAPSCSSSRVAYYRVVFGFCLQTSSNDCITLKGVIEVTVQLIHPVE